MRRHVNKWVNEWVTEWVSEETNGCKMWGKKRRKIRRFCETKKDRWGRTRLQTYFFNRVILIIPLDKWYISSIKFIFNHCSCKHWWMSWESKNYSLTNKNLNLNLTDKGITWFFFFVWDRLEWKPLLNENLNTVQSLALQRGVVGLWVLGSIPTITQIRWRRALVLNLLWWPLMKDTPTLPLMWGP